MAFAGSKLNVRTELIKLQIRGQGWCGDRYFRSDERLMAVAPLTTEIVIHIDIDDHRSAWLAEK